jgi:hypothetical protein
MEFEIAFDVDSKLVSVRTWGIASIEGASAYMRALVSDPRWRREMDVLSDHTALNAGHLTAHDIEALVGVFVPIGNAIGTGRRAIVTGSSLKFGLGRMFEAHAARQLPFQPRIFATVEEASAWLRASDQTLDAEECDAV